jgi:crotonobetainyl-CoA:carnitine CoA-transferase CaiB-like acyl-CoA transferase
MTFPLSGLLVVSLEQAVAAPMCTCRLADAGARVVKVERPEGDFARYYDRLAQGESAYFVWLNRGKESACLDLTQPDDKALFSIAPYGAFKTKDGADILISIQSDREWRVLAERGGQGACGGSRFCQQCGTGQTSARNRRARRGRVCCNRRNDTDRQACHR